ncbi:MAG: porin [Planctomycetota bacterium]|nr:porin [Planctomycetota bacterium]
MMRLLLLGIAVVAGNWSVGFAFADDNVAPPPPIDILPLPAAESAEPVDPLLQMQRKFDEQSRELDALRTRVGMLEANPPASSLRTDTQPSRDPMWQDLSNRDFRGRWKNSLWFETEDGDFKANIGGRLEQDWLWATADSALENQVGSFDDGIFFRRARIHGAGTIYGKFDLFAEFEAAPVDNLLFQDAWMQVRDVPGVGNLRVGHLLVPFGLENMTSARFITFMERSAVHDAFQQEYDPGMMVWDNAADDNIYWAVALLRFDPDESGRSFGDGDYSMVGRLTSVPWSEDDGRYLMHVGASVRGTNAPFNGNLGTDAFQFRARPEIRNTPRLVDTGSVPSDSALFAVAEFAIVMDNTSVQAEYVTTHLRNAANPTTRAPVGDLNFSGYYVYASWFLTGEHRTYVRNRGGFGRITPKVNVSPSSEVPMFCSGAYEIGVRFAHVDLNDGPVVGGVLNTVTVGLNWHLNTNAKIMLNYVHATRDNTGAGDGASDLLGMRYHVEY